MKVIDAVMDSGADTGTPTVGSNVLARFSRGGRRAAKLTVRMLSGGPEGPEDTVADSKGPVATGLTSGVRVSDTGRCVVSTK